MNLNQITIHVSNLERSILFYKKIGLVLIVNSPGNGYARFECPDGGTTFSLHQTENASPSGASYYFEVEDVDGVVKALKEKGLAFESDPEDKRYLWREAWCRDPDGHHIGIYHAGENRRFPPWRIRDQERGSVE